MHHNVIIVIPIYKKILSLNEKKSFIQCLNILNKYDICLLCPDSLCINNYFNIVKTISSDNRIKVKRFNNLYFENIKGYNRLMKSLIFYKTFNNYNYILIYQLDAWVFKDNLEYWCNKNYNYIGAPWFKGYNKPQQEIIGIGNGGLSLRKTKIFITILKRIFYIRKIHLFLPKIGLKGGIRNTNTNLLCKLIFYFLKINYNNKSLLIEIIEANNFNEDAEWSIFYPQIFIDYIIPNYKEVISFSFEANPSYLYKKNKNELPFGCHAWEKFEPKFWTEFIK